MQTLKSTIDESVNFVTESKVGSVEARYVRREPHYISAYVSSQTGCNRGCGFCHLTTTNQKAFTDVDIYGFGKQARQIIDYAKDREPAEIINWNFMARGEPLANKYLLDYSTGAFFAIHNMTCFLDTPVVSRFNISTIMPVTLKKPLSKVFPLIQPTLYYSIYSVDPKFRNKWMPAAMPVDDALDSLKEYQDVTGKEIKFHGSFIKGENDSTDSIFNMMDVIYKSGIRGSFNLVRYNPYSEAEGEETHWEDLIRIQNIIAMHMPARIITRVGKDVSASCGQFVNTNA